MRTLILMRHAKSDWSQPGLSDHDRPLNTRGRKAAPRIAEKLRDEGIQADVILASSARRVQETLERMRPIWGGSSELITEKSLYLASPEQMLKTVQGLHDSWNSAMLVGHNPGIVSLVCHLDGIQRDMPTAAVAIFRTALDRWSDARVGAWKLVAHWKPRELEA